PAEMPHIEPAEQKTRHVGETVPADCHGPKMHRNRIVEGKHNCHQVHVCLRRAQYLSFHKRKERWHHAKMFAHGQLFPFGFEKPGESGTFETRSVSEPADRSHRMKHA